MPPHDCESQHMDAPMTTNCERNSTDAVSTEIKKNNNNKNVLPNNHNNSTNWKEDAKNALSSLRLLRSRKYWENAYNRCCYEIALLLAAIPHLIPKVFILQYCAFHIFRNMAHSRHMQGPRLHDLGFDMIPESRDYNILSDVVVIINATLSWIAVLMPIFSSNNEFHNRGIYTSDFILKNVNVLSVGHVLRFFTFISTSLPGPAPHCQPGSTIYHDTNMSTYELFRRRATVAGGDPNCGDLIFSGHMLQIMTFSTIVLSNLNTLVTNKFIARIMKYLIILTVIVEPYFIISARNHYTVDVVIAIYISPMLCWSMEGIYMTDWYKNSCQYVSTRLVPTSIQNYLKENNPCSSVVNGRKD